MAPLALVGLAAYTSFHCIGSRNAYPGNGAEHIDSEEAQAPNKLDIDGCHDFCSQDAGCECVVYMQSEGICWKRRNCQPRQFVHDAAFSVCIRSGGTRPTQTTTTIPAIDCGGRPKQRTVNVSMIANNVNYALLYVSPGIANEFKKAVQVAIATHVGPAVHPECVDVTLSPGSVAINAAVSPAHGELAAVAAELSGSKMSLGDAVGIQVAPVVDKSGAATGSLFISDICVKAPEIDAGNSFLWWLWVLLMLLILALACIMCAFFAMTKNSRLRKTIDWIINKVKGYGSGRELVPLDEDELNPNGIKVHFLDTTNADKMLIFRSAPFGLIMSEEDPAKVSGFNPVGSYAKEKGVQLGWRVKQVEDNVVTPKCASGSVQQMLADASRGLEVYPLKIDFEQGGGEVKTIYFREGPLGMEFFNGLPIVIDEFKRGGTAKEMGVELGWTLLRIGDVDLSTDVDFEQACKYLSDAVAQLPAKGSRRSSNKDSESSLTHDDTESSLTQ